MSDVIEKNEQMFENMEEALKVGIKEVNSGEVVTGTVVAVRDDEVLVDIGAKSEGTIPIREFSCCDIKLTSDVVKVGDKIEAYIIRVIDSEGKIILSKRKADAAKSMIKLNEAYKNGEIVNGNITEVVKGGVLVDLGGIQGFIPASLVDVGYVEKLDLYIGMNVDVKIIEMNPAKHKVVLSRKAILAQDYAKRKEETWAKISVGQVVKGTVRRLTNFGAFVDIGGIDGLLHISEMSWQRVNNPSEIVNVGDEVEVAIIGIDKSANKVSLSLKKVLPNPWEKIEEKYPIGSVVTGKIAKILTYGAFIELEPGVDGLVHISQLANQRVVKVEDVVSIGQEVKAKVIDIKQDEKRISLSIKEVTNDQVKNEEQKEVDDFLQNQNEEGKVTLGDVFKDTLKEV